MADMLFGAYIPLWQEGIPNVTGYRQHLYELDAEGHMVFPSVNGPIPATWPALPEGAPEGVVGFYTIYPNPTLLLNGQLDEQLLTFLNSAPPQGGILTAFAEADAQAGTGGQFAPLGLTQDIMQEVHLYMLSLCAGTNVKYGVVYQGETPECIAFGIGGLDFYAIDWYDNPNKADVFQVLNQFRANVGKIQSYPCLAVSETNSNQEPRRPWWFASVYAWLALYGQAVGWEHVLGFWSYWHQGGPLSGPWDPQDAATIEVLFNIAMDCAGQGQQQPIPGKPRAGR